MIQIGKLLISSDLFDKKFRCYMEICKGRCCVQGDAGAPLNEDEISILETEYVNIRDFLTTEGISAIEKSGKWVTDHENDLVTPLIGTAECAYTVFENGIARCGIEKAWEAGKTFFRKPVSCHLYPVRVSKIGDYRGLNFHQWSVCQPARILGDQLGIPVYRFLKDAVIRAFGDDFYKEMEEVAEKMKNS